ncbi:MAG: hypothetical protein MJ105_01015 [Lachnospiraceae bacterium]|nr:hypothetical protein [Lachnospiraceae bacterium]
MKKREESFPITKEIVDDFIKINSKQWSEILPNGKYIYINLSMVRMQAAWVIPKLLYAKGIQEKTGAVPVAITWSNNELLTRFFDSFGIKHISLDDLCYKHPFLGLKSFFKSFFSLYAHKDSKYIKEIKIKDLDIGYSLYEDILRTSSLSTLKTSRNKIAFKKTFHILWVVYCLQNFIKKNPLQYAVMDDLAYHEEMLVRLFLKSGAKVVACEHESETFIQLREDGTVKRRPQMANEKLHPMGNGLISASDLEIAMEWTNNYLNERFQGKNGRAIDRGAFAGKKILNKEEMHDLIGSDREKKTVVIMAHTFTDAIYNYGFYYFRDYYDWLENTLKIACEVDNVNWILKPHPTRKSYNESTDSIEDMFEHYHKENMYILSDDVSSESIKNIADVIVTIGGNAGAEYACFGIPSIIVGRPYYAGFGYTYEPKTYEEYQNLLTNVRNIEHLSEDQTNKAKYVFYLQNHPSENELLFKDDFARMIQKQYNQMFDEIALSYFKDNSETKTYNDDILKNITEYYQSHNMKEVEYFKRGYQFADN